MRSNSWIVWRAFVRTVAAMPSVEGSNEIEFVDRGTDLRTDRGGHARRVDLVHLVYSVYLVYALSLV